MISTNQVINFDDFWLFQCISGPISSTKMCPRGWRLWLQDLRVLTLPMFAMRTGGEWLQISLPGTQMTPVLLGKGLLLEGWNPKIEDKQVPGMTLWLQMSVPLDSWKKSHPQAAIFAARRGATAVSMDDFERATERVIGGLPKSHGKMGHQGAQGAQWISDFQDFH